MCIRDSTKANEVITQKKNVAELTKEELKLVVSGGKIRDTKAQADRLKETRNAKTRPLGFLPDKAPERELVKLGCYRVVMRGGVPQLSKAAVTPFNAQRILLTDDMGEMTAFIELTQWKK